MTATASITNKNIKRNVVRRKKRSVAYTATVLLIIYMLYSYIWPIYFEEAVDNNLLLDILLSYIPRIALILFFGKFIIKKSQSKEFKKSIFLFSAFIITAAVSFIVAHSGLTRFIGFVFIGVLLMFYSQYRMKPREIKKLYCYLLLSSVIVIWNSLSLQSYRSGDVGINPNTVAFMFMIIYCISLVYFKAFKKIGYLLMAGVCVALQFVYGSRTALLGILLFTVALIVFRGFRRTFNHYTVSTVLFAVAALGIIVAYLYCYTLYDKYGKGTIFIFGKDIFTGRQVIWRGIFESLRQNIWFGVGSNINSKYFVAGANDLSGVMNNAHNQSLGTLATFGLAPTVFFYLFLVQFIGSRYKFDIVNRVPALYFATILAMSFFEAYFFSMRLYPIILVGYALIYNLSIGFVPKGARARR